MSRKQKNTIALFLSVVLFITGIPVDGRSVRVREADALAAESAAGNGPSEGRSMEGGADWKPETADGAWVADTEASDGQEGAQVEEIRAEEIRTGALLEEGTRPEEGAEAEVSHSGEEILEEGTYPEEGAEAEGAYPGEEILEEGTYPEEGAEGAYSGEEILEEGTRPGEEIQAEGSLTEEAVQAEGMRTEGMQGTDAGTGAGGAAGVWIEKIEEIEGTGETEEIGAAGRTEETETEAESVPAGTVCRVVFMTENLDGGYSAACSRIVEGEGTGAAPEGDGQWGLPDTEAGREIADYFVYNGEKTEAFNRSSAETGADGFSEICLFYDRKEYSIKFYYCREDADGNCYGADGFSGFLGSAEDVTDACWDVELSGRPVPDARTTAQFSENSFGSEWIGSSRYYYFTLTARYGDDLTSLWPKTPFKPLEGFVFSGWIPQPQSGLCAESVWKTVTGAYSSLDEALILDPEQELAQFMAAAWERVEEETEDRLGTYAEIQSAEEGTEKGTEERIGERTEEGTEEGTKERTEERTEEGTEEETEEGTEERTGEGTEERTEEGAEEGTEEETEDRLGTYAEIQSAEEGTEEGTEEETEKGTEGCSWAGGEDPAVSAEAGQDAADTETLMMEELVAGDGETLFLAERSYGANEILPAAEEEDYVSVTIHYQMENGESIFSDYVATLHQGSDFSAVVPSPSYVGYAPYIWDGETENYLDASSVRISYSDLMTNQELTVVYLPALSPYKVRYYLQNVTDDGYTEDASLAIDGRALTGTYPQEDIEIGIEGFSSLFHEPDTVAADGTTEFHCYYDRNYYLYQFDCNGGHGVDPVYARYGTPLAVGTPVRPGYVFQGWDRQDEDGNYDGAADPLPSSIGAKNETYRAIWAAVETKVTVVYWNENPDDDNYNFWDSTEVTVTSGEVITLAEDILPEDSRIRVRPTEAVVPDSEFRHYTLNQERTAQYLGENGTLVEGDGSTVINIYYKRKNYTLRFYYARQNQAGQYYVVGGSTYGFNRENTTDVQTNLGNVTPENWGRVNKITFNDIGDGLVAAGRYRPGEVTYGDYTYYYFDLTAKYGTSLKELWPVYVFDPVYSYDATDKNYPYAVFSAWNGEHHVQYSITQSQGLKNYTIKGNYIRLDDMILYGTEYQDKYLQDENGNDLVNFLAFWENGAAIDWSKALKWTYNIYMEALPRETEGKTEKELEDDPNFVQYANSGMTKWYKLFESYICCDNNGGDGSGLAQQTPPGTKGFDYIGSTYQEGNLTEEEKTYYQSAHVGNFFYDRTRYLLRLSSQGVYLTSDGTEVPYGRNLVSQVKQIVENSTGVEGTLEPGYPSTLEPGAYEFAGWYRSPLFLEGTELTETSEMLATPMTYYAYWKPVTRKVTFSNTYDEMVEGNYITVKTDEEGNPVTELSVGHRENLVTSDIPEASSEALGTETEYTFIGWFYTDNEGNVKAFDPYTMVVTDDLHLFAQWASSAIVSYTVHYLYRDTESGTEVAVAEDTTGYTYAGTTKTFTARTGQELKEGYQTGYYPVVNSSSIIASVNSPNEVTFWYEKKDQVTYRVRYLDKATGAALREEKEITTHDAVVTEKFEYISGYISDAFYKRLVLTADEEQNVITFYYTPDTQNAYYAVKYLTEDLDGQGYTEYTSYEGIEKSGETVSAEAIPITGFTYDVTATVERNQDANVTVTAAGVSASLPIEGRVLYLCYRRNESSYEVKYVEYDNPDHELKDPDNHTGKYGETKDVTAPEEIVVTESDSEVRYRLIGTPNRTISFAEKPQTLYYYYQAETVTVTYIPVSLYPGQIGGTVTVPDEAAANVNALAGSSPVAKENWRFAGWYHDAACTQKVTEGVDDKNHLKPVKFYGENDEWDNTYYALFEPLLGDLTVTKSGVEAGDGNQTFLFAVKGTAGTVTAGIDLTVDIAGNGSATVRGLPVGSYTVTEQQDWSWRYEAQGDSSRSVTVEADTANSVSFVNQKADAPWLGGEGYVDNHFSDVNAG